MSWLIQASLNMQEVLGKLIKRIPCSDSWMSERYGGRGTANENIVSKVLWCVTAKQAMVPYCQENGYDLIISHHPDVFINDFPQMVFHTALDCTKGGLNDQWSTLLGVKNAKHFDKNLGWYGEIDPITFKDLVAKCEGFIEGSIGGRKYAEEGDDTIITSVVICTGLGGMVEYEAAMTGADCWIFGEGVYASTYANFKAFIEVGHTKSEKIGINVIREVLEPFGIQVDQAPDSLDWYGDEDPSRIRTEKEIKEDEEWYKEQEEWGKENRKQRLKDGIPLDKWNLSRYKYTAPTYSYPPYPSYSQDYYNPKYYTPGENLNWDTMTEAEWQKWKEGGYTHPSQTGKTLIPGTEGVKEGETYVPPEIWERWTDQEWAEWAAGPRTTVLGPANQTTSMDAWERMEEAKEKQWSQANPDVGLPEGVPPPGMTDAEWEQWEKDHPLEDELHDVPSALTEEEKKYWQEEWDKGALPEPEPPKD
jgi:putative NIF3 family GTP cyclohydrolase 1 type 2